MSFVSPGFLIAGPYSQRCSEHLHATATAHQSRVQLPVTVQADARTGDQPVVNAVPSHCGLNDRLSGRGRGPTPCGHARRSREEEIQTILMNLHEVPVAPPQTSAEAYPIVYRDPS